MSTTKEVRMIDIYDPQEEVEIIIRDNKVWINVDGVCRLRVGGIKKELLSIDYSPSEWLKLKE